MGKVDGEDEGVANGKELIACYVLGSMKVDSCFGHVQHVQYVLSIKNQEFYLAPESCSNHSEAP